MNYVRSTAVHTQMKRYEPRHCVLPEVRPALSWLAESPNSDISGSVTPAITKKTAENQPGTCKHLEFYDLKIQQYGGLEMGEGMGETSRLKLAEVQM